MINIYLFSAIINLFFILLWTFQLKKEKGVSHKDMFVVRQLAIYIFLLPVLNTIWIFGIILNYIIYCIEKKYE